MENLEKRGLVPSEFEVRNDENGKDVYIEGYAAKFDEETVIAGQFIERIARGAFDGTDMSNTVALFNHDMDKPLARVGEHADALELSVDDTGLKYRFKAGNQSYAKDLVENIRMSIVSTSSFAFNVEKDSWEKRDGNNVRTIESVGTLFDVSPTTQGAYDATSASVALRSMDLAFANEEVRALEEEVAAEETEVREDEAIETVETAVEETIEEAPEAVEEETTAEEAEIENQEEAPASEEEEEQDTPEATENEEVAEEEINTESEAGPADEEESIERASEISTTMENTNNAPAVVQSLGDNSAELRKKFDLGKAIQEAANGQVTGLEAEARQEAAKEAKEHGISFTGNVGVPSEFRADAAAMTAGTAGVQTNEGIFDDGQAALANYRPFEKLEKLGVFVYDNPTGDIVIPVQTGNITPATLNELADVDLTNAAFTQERVSPQRIAAGTSYSKELMMQDSMGLGRLLLADMNKEMSIKAEQYVLGVIEAAITYTNDTLGAYSGGASAPDFAELAFLMEADLRAAHVDPARAKFLLNAANLRNFKRAAMDAGSGIFAGTEQNIGGYGFETSELVTAGNILLGDFSDVLVARWGGLDIVVDPYTGAQQNVVKVVANSHIGAGVRRTASFKGVQVA